MPAQDALNADGETPAWQDWAPSTPEERAAFGDQLIADVQELYDYVHSDDFTQALDDQGVAGSRNGAIALLDEVATGKITGEEDWWSGTDLYDFAANVEGSKMAFSLVRDFADGEGRGRHSARPRDRRRLRRPRGVARRARLADRRVRRLPRAHRRRQARAHRPDQRARRAALAADRRRCSTDMTDRADHREPERSAAGISRRGTARPRLGAAGAVARSPARASPGGVAAARRRHRRRRADARHPSTRSSASTRRASPHPCRTTCTSRRST